MKYKIERKRLVDFKEAYDRLTVLVGNVEEDSKHQSVLETMVDFRYRISTYLLGMDRALEMLGIDVRKALIEDNANFCTLDTDLINTVIRKQYHMKKEMIDIQNQINSSDDLIQNILNENELYKRFDEMMGNNLAYHLLGFAIDEKKLFYKKCFYPLQYGEKNLVMEHYKKKHQIVSEKIYNEQIINIEYFVHKQYYKCEQERSRMFSYDLYDEVLDINYKEAFKQMRLDLEESKKDTSYYEKEYSDMLKNIDAFKAIFIDEKGGENAEESNN